MAESDDKNHPPLLRGSDPAFWRASLALFVGGLATFASLYLTQPLLPLFAREFGVSPAVASLSLSLTTGAVAPFLLVGAAASEVWGRKALMGVSLFASAILTLLVATSPSFGALLVWRAIQGITLAGLPATSIAYLGEEVAASAMGLAIGLYISGNTVGGMVGRLSTGLLTDWLGWRQAIGIMGAISLGCAIGFWTLLPPSRHFLPRSPSPRALLHTMRGHLADPGLRLLFLLAFLLMGCFVSLYNYIGFQLAIPPYSLSQAQVAWIFLLYLVGTFSATFMGRVADRVGRRHLLWSSVAVMGSGSIITLSDSLWLKVGGVAIYTFGFFAAHSLASSWVARRAVTHRSQASAVYLLAYYVGASVIGAVAGVFWSQSGWVGVVGMIASLLALALLVALRLARIPPIVVV